MNKKCIGQFYINRIQIMMEIARKKGIYLRNYNTIEEMYQNEKVDKYTVYPTIRQDSFLSPGNFWAVSEDIDLSEFWKEVNEICPHVLKYN